MEQYGLRNTLYPAFLSIPLHILRMLKLDYNWLVLVSPLCMNSILQFIGDYFGFKLAERLINKKVAMIFLSYSLFNARINELFQRTMTNGAEASCVVVAFYHLSKLQFVQYKTHGKDSKKVSDSLISTQKGGRYLIFEKNLVIMTISITLAFIVRSSSLVGWIPIAIATMYNSYSYWCIFYNLLVMI